MLPQMLLLIRNLVKCIEATGDRALKGLLTSVDPQVIEEIVPFSEYFFALKPVFFAEIGALDPPCVNIIEFNFCEI